MPFYDFWRAKNVTAAGRRWGRQAAEYTIDKTARYSVSLRSVVEIGPGRGWIARVCDARGISHIGIDANSGLLTDLESSHAVCAFAPPLPLQSAMCDAAVANHVLEHSAGLPQAQALVAEMRRIVRPGGLVTITSPDVLWQGIEFWDCDYSHNYVTTARRLQQLFHDQGLDVVYLDYVHNHLDGIAGRLAGQLSRLTPYHVAGAPPLSRLYVDQLYKLRMTFARAVLIIGRVP